MPTALPPPVHQSSKHTGAHAMLCTCGRRCLQGRRQMPSPAPPQPGGAAAPPPAAGQSRWAPCSGAQRSAAGRWCARAGVQAGPAGAGWLLLDRLPCWGAANLATSGSLAQHLSQEGGRGRPHRAATALPAKRSPTLSQEPPPPPPSPLPRPHFWSEAVQGPQCRTRAPP